MAGRSLNILEKGKLLPLCLRAVCANVPTPAKCLSGSATRTKESPTVDFSDTANTYKPKSTRELLRSYLVFTAFQYDILVNNSHKLINMGKRLLGQSLFERLMKISVFGQFVAGENTEDIRPVVTKFRNQGIRPIFAYSVEDDLSHSGLTATHVMKEENREVERMCDKNTEHIIQCINMAGNSSDAFAAFKITALAPVQLLIRFSEVIVDTHRLFLTLADRPSLIEGCISPHSLQNSLRKQLAYSEIDRLWNQMSTHELDKLDLFSWTERYLTSRELQEALRSKNIEALSDTERDQITLLVRRAETLAQCAQETGVRLMVDAEQTYYQPAIRHVAVNILMPKYNLTRPVIYNTQQCYLKDAWNTTLLDLATAEAKGFILGVKTVRGAYIELERLLAQERGYEDPIWPTKEETDSSYHRVLGKVLEKVKEGKASVMVATHNEKTVHLALEKIHQHGLIKQDGSVVFGQLLGMSDHISLSLGSAGYLAYKYMPYGPVMEVMPYLIRRVNENRGILAGALRERKLLSRELKRRMFW